jgi:hypothetical protein
MKRPILAFFLALLIAAGAAKAQILNSGPGLPGILVNQAPVTLPPNMIEILPINHDASYYGDAVRIVDCPNQSDQPFGLCRNFLFGGDALMVTNLQGYIQIQFYPPVNGISHFEVTHPQNLAGDDTVISAPDLYQMPVTQNYVQDPFTGVSSGDLDTTTGIVSNLDYSVLVSNSWYTALQNANPKLVGNPFTFPGPYGYAQAVFTPRPDGLLDFTFTGSSFLPLGASTLGDPTSLPLPLCGPYLNCASVQAAGMSLHPTLRISTIAESNPACGPQCPALPVNGDMIFTSHSYSTTLGDNFNLNVPQLGGLGPARSQLTGRTHVQFGAPNGKFQPFIIGALPPEGVLGPYPNPGIVGFAFGMLGSSEMIYFPLQTYFFMSVGTGDDPFNVALGEVNLTTGYAVGDFIFRSYFTQSIFQGLAKLNPGISPASEPFQGPLHFDVGPNGEIVEHFAGEIHISFVGFAFPAPSLTTGYVTQPGSMLDLFYHHQAMHTVDTASATKSGSGQNITSSIGDVFSYNYTIPCNPVGSNGAFTYTNNNASGKASAGSFTLKSLSSVSCINSLTSEAQPGDYDTIQFAGYGSWSADSNPHLVNAQISTSPNYPIVHIMIDAGTTSIADTKPADNPPPPAVSPNNP